MALVEYDFWHNLKTPAQGTNFARFRIRQIKQPVHATWRIAFAEAWYSQKRGEKTSPADDVPNEKRASDDWGL